MECGKKIPMKGKGFPSRTTTWDKIMKKIENLREKVPGAVEFLCQKESHQSVSVVLG